MESTENKDLTALKAVLKSTEFAVYHETSVLENKEVVFTTINKNTLDQSSQAEIAQYVNNNPIDEKCGLSEPSRAWLNERQAEHFVIILARVDKGSLFEAQEIEFIKQNTNNYVAKKIIGEPVNLSQEFDSLFNQFTYKTGAVVLGAVGMASEAVQNTLQNIKNTSPNELLDKGANQVSALLGGFKARLKQKIEQTQQKQNDQNSKPKM